MELFGHVALKTFLLVVQRYKLLSFQLLIVRIDSVVFYLHTKNRA